jgi:branched-chain amino acid transport system substrate-binding protein
MSLRLNRRTALKGVGALAVTAAAGTALKAPAIAQNAPIRIGSVATLEGPFATGGQDAYRAMEMLFQAENMTIGGRRIEWIRESSNAQADVALARARKLIEQDNVDFIIGPLSGAEGIALKDYSATLTGKTIINGSSGAADTTLRNPSRNFFRFNTDGTQWMAGLGTYVRRTLNVSASASSSAGLAARPTISGRRWALPTSPRRSRRSPAARALSSSSTAAPMASPS